MSIRAHLDDWTETSNGREDGNVSHDIFASQSFHPILAVGMNPMSELRLRIYDKTLSTSQGNLEALDVLFSRYRRVLSLVAYRVLGNHQEAEYAVQNCLLAVSNNVPRFEYEGAFRSWLVRVLMDEASLILHNKRARSNNAA
jgi:hypothetical protein